MLIEQRTMRRFVVVAATLIVALGMAPAAAAQTGSGLDRALGELGGSGQPLSLSLQILLMMSLLTVLPSLLLMMTSFTRIIIVLSFVRQADDVDMLIKALRRTRKRPGIVLKIETPQAFAGLGDILMRGLSAGPLGVMVARGDLAVEVGFARLAEVQEEILWLCEAAHMPVVWATQVLEELARTGSPSRAEVTDAAMGVRAECVMLNKGPYVCEAVHFLTGVLDRMQAHQYKKFAMLRQLAVSRMDAARPHKDQPSQLAAGISP